MTTIEFSIGDRVEAGHGEDHDCGRIVAIGGQTDDTHDLNRPGYYLIAWDSGVRTWTPGEDLVSE